jgi:hypothetical protein
MIDGGRAHTSYSDGAMNDTMLTIEMLDRPLQSMIEKCTEL